MKVFFALATTLPLIVGNPAQAAAPLNDLQMDRVAAGDLACGGGVCGVTINPGSPSGSLFGTSPLSNGTIPVPGMAGGTNLGSLPTITTAFSSFPVILDPTQ